MSDSTKVVWFNTWFSAIINSINSIKSMGVRVIGTNISAECVYKYAVDEFYIEPKMNDRDYVEYAINFCSEHNVDIFFPKAHLTAIADNKHRFEEINTVVVCEDYETIKCFDSKAQVYMYLGSCGYEAVPEYILVDTVDEFKAAYEYFKSQEETVCIKFDSDEGAASFRVVTDSFLTYNSMRSKIENMVSYSNMIKILCDGEETGKFKPLMVMPKLLSPEVSVDCYEDNTGEFIALPRYKLGNRVKKIVLDKNIIDDCKFIQSKFNFKYAFNVQYRWTKDGGMRLLEINPRMSGGIHLSSMSGYNIPMQIVADILGVKLEQSKESIKEVLVTQYEYPVEI